MYSSTASWASLLLLATSVVHAGNQLWEGNVQLQAPHPVERIEVDAAGYAVRDNATQNAVMKRWTGLIPKEGPNESVRWPEKTISYCYATQEARDKLYKYLKNARNKWQTAGLNSLVYKYQQVAEPGPDCTNNPQRSKILVISYNDKGKLSTTLGMPALDADDKSYKGPYMILSDADNVGTLDVTANIAHELGHAWGLGHEHQNPYFWKGYDFSDPNGDEMPHGANVGDKPPFRKAWFKCSALKDYESVHARVWEEHPADLEDLCKKRNIAAKHSFSAVDWLPDNSLNMKKGVVSNFATKDDVDWLSIMLYPSGAGGKGDAAPPEDGQELGANDHRENVLVGADGKGWHGNFVPSELDVKGIRNIYEDNNFPEGEPVLISDESNKFNSKFRSIIGRAKCRIIPDE